MCLCSLHVPFYLTNCLQRRSTRSTGTRHTPAANSPRIEATRPMPQYAKTCSRLRNTSNHKRWQMQQIRPEELTELLLSLMRRRSNSTQHVQNVSSAEAHMASSKFFVVLIANMKTNSLRWLSAEHIGIKSTLFVNGQLLAFLAARTWRRKLQMLGLPHRWPQRPENAEHAVTCMPARASHVQNRTPR